jgi:hypothetical protein
LEKQNHLKLYATTIKVSASFQPRQALSSLSQHSPPIRDNL